MPFHGAYAVGLGDGEVLHIRDSEVPEKLDEAALLRARDLCGLSEGVDHDIKKLLQTLNARSTLRAMYFRLRWLLFDEPSYPSARVRAWPYPIQNLCESTGIFYLVLALDAIPRMLEAHRQRGIPESIGLACCGYFVSSVGLHMEQEGGVPGFKPRVLSWVRNIARGDVIRLGRLEYIRRPFFGPIYAFRNRETGAVIALMTGGMWLDSEGFLSSMKTGIQTRYVDGGQSVIGRPVLPDGHVMNFEVSLPFPSWERALAAGDPMLEIHIPPGGSMTPSSCRESMLRAVEFFDTTFPDRPFLGLTCTSWVLNPQLSSIYRSDSNMVKWQNELYLYPWKSGRSALYFLFGQDEIDLKIAPRDTSLRRSFLDHLERGGVLRDGGMFILREEIKKIGTRAYRRHWGELPLSDMKCGTTESPMSIPQHESS